MKTHNFDLGDLVSILSFLTTLKLASDINRIYEDTAM